MYATQKRFFLERNTQLARAGTHRLDASSAGFYIVPVFAGVSLHFGYRCAFQRIGSLFTVLLFSLSLSLSLSLSACVLCGVDCLHCAVSVLVLRSHKAPTSLESRNECGVKIFLDATSTTQRIHKLQHWLAQVGVYVCDV